MAFINISKCGSFSPDYFLKVKGVFLKSLLCSHFCTKVLYKMKSAYFHNNQGEEKVEINIAFNEFNKNGVLKFERNISETLDDFLQRLENKVRQFLARKIKKKTFESDDEFSVYQKMDMFFLSNNQRLPNDCNFVDFFNKKFSGELKLRIFDSDYDVLINSPVVKKLSLPKVLRVGCLAYPEKFETMSTLEDKSEFMWYRSPRKNTKKLWEKCGEGFFYNLKMADNEHFIKLTCTPKNLSEVGPMYEVVSDEEVKVIENTEEIAKRQNTTAEVTGDGEFRFVTYNILAECYTQTKEAKTSLFTYCNPEYLDFNYRKCLLNFEFRGYNADIMCLQEVDSGFYKNELVHWFYGMNYSCLFHEKEGAREGCLFVFNPIKFNLLSIDKHVFTNELLNNEFFCDISEKLKENLKSRLQNISSLIQLAVVQSRTVSDQILIIGNTHFYFHPNACHIRLLQGIVSCSILSKKAEEILQQYPDKKVSILLCGDFNSTPETCFHKLIREGSVDEKCSDWNSCPEEAIENVSFGHHMKLQSAYSTDKYTNYTPLFKGCLDYIYFQTDHLEVKQTVPVPSEETLSQEKGIPNKYFPSDHVALIADLKFKT